MRQSKENSQNRRSWLAKRVKTPSHSIRGRILWRRDEFEISAKFFWGETDELHPKRAYEGRLGEGELRQGGRGTSGIACSAKDNPKSLPNQIFLCLISVAGRNSYRVSFYELCHHWLFDRYSPSFVLA